VVPVLRDVLVPASFSAEEAARIGLVDEASVQWDGQLDINVDDLHTQGGQAAQAAEAAEAAAAALPPVLLPGMPEWAVDAEPLSGRELADAVQIGFAYRMHINSEWHKVRLSHVSAGRSFFIFTRGARHQQTISLTHRMLVRLCEAERFRAIETRTLLERATVRARQQLAELAAATRAGSGSAHSRLH
jgi:enoyl-CoA hydratase/carnithine racemase